ncbi:hypothetical protein, partial [Klebsiella pneumoniae]|uniref:hypothetical protein n=1 Tax=Klebsiella pneumoniae TaxID=573 RepID=UPI002DBB678D
KVGSPLINALETANKMMSEYGKTNSNSNQFQATGIKLNTADPTINTVFNKVLTGVDVSFHNINDPAGKTASGTSKSLGSYKVDSGPILGRSQEGDFTFSRLMEATGAKNPMELVQSVSMMPNAAGGN